MRRLGILDFLRNRDRVDRALGLLEVVERLADGIIDRAELAQRLAAGAERGDLDDVLLWAKAHDERVRRFREGR